MYSIRIVPCVSFVESNVTGGEGDVVKLRVNRTGSITRKLKCKVRIESTTAEKGVCGGLGVVCMCVHMCILACVYVYTWCIPNIVCACMCVHSCMLYNSVCFCSVPVCAGMLYVMDVTLCVCVMYSRTTHIWLTGQCFPKC